MDTSKRICLIAVRNSCAAMNGIDQNIITRANELAFLIARGDNLAAACAVLSPEETQALEEAVRNPLKITKTYWLTFAQQDSLARRFLEIDISENNLSDPESMLMSLFEDLRE